MARHDAPDAANNSAATIVGLDAPSPTHQPSQETDYDMSSQESISSSVSVQPQTPSFVESSPGIFLPPSPSPSTISSGSGGQQVFPGYSLRLNEDSSGGGQVVFDQDQRGFLSMPISGTWIISADDDIIGAPFPVLTETQATLTSVYKSQGKRLHQYDDNSEMDSGFGESSSQSQTMFKKSRLTEEEEDMISDNEPDMDESIILAGSFKFCSPAKQNEHTTTPSKILPDDIDMSDEESIDNSAIDRELNEPDATEPFNLAKMIEDVEILQASKLIPPDTPYPNRLEKESIPMFGMLSPIRHEGNPPPTISPNRGSLSPPRFFRPWKSSSPKTMRIETNERTLSIVEKFRKMCTSTAAAHQESRNANSESPFKKGNDAKQRNVSS